MREARARVRERERAQTIFQLGLLNTEHSQLTLRLCDRYPRLPKLKLKPLFKDILCLQAVLAAQQALFRERREMVALWRALLNQKQTFKGERYEALISAVIFKLHFLEVERHHRSCWERFCSKFDDLDPQTQQECSFLFLSFNLRISFFGRYRMQDIEHLLGFFPVPMMFRPK